MCVCVCVCVCLCVCMCVCLCVRVCVCVSAHVRFFPHADLGAVLSRDVSQLSGGELQRFAIAMCAVQKADV